MSDKGGRPAKPERMRRTELIQFRVTRDEADAIDKGALKRGETLGDYILRRLGFRMLETP